MKRPCCKDEVGTSLRQKALFVLWRHHGNRRAAVKGDLHLSGCHDPLPAWGEHPVLLLDLGSCCAQGALGREWAGTCSHVCLFPHGKGLKFVLAREIWYFSPCFPVASCNSGFCAKENGSFLPDLLFVMLFVFYFYSSPFWDEVSTLQWDELWEDVTAAFQYIKWLIGKTETFYLEKS